MTGRERLLRLLNGKSIDRVPVSPCIYTNFISEFFGTSEVDFVEKGIELYEYFGFDIILRTCNVWDCMSERLCDSQNWRYSETREGDEKEWEIIESIKTPEKELTQITRYKKITKHEVIQAVVEYYIKDVDDFVQFAKYQPPVPKYDCSIISKARQLLGDKGLAAPWSQGAFNSASFYRKLDDLIIDPYINPEFYNSMMLYFSDRMLKVIGQFAEAGADMVCCSGNVANGTMTGPEHFEKFILPYEKEFVKRVKDLGVFYLYHNCGDANSILHLYSEIKMDIYESLTPPPYGDTILEDAFSKISKDIVLCGNIDQIEFLMTASTDEIRNKVKTVMEAAKKRGNFILATTDYFSEGTPYDSIKAFADAGREFGSYK